jgi:beta-ketoacyl synthase-like protein
MTELANEMPITAGAFSHSVHNTAAGLHSIVTRNAQASSSTAGGDDTFGSGVVEALGLLDRSAARHTLLVVGDVPVPTLFAPLAQEPACPYAVGFLVAGGDDDDDAIDVSFEPALTARHPWPDAVELLRWLLSSEPAVSVGSRRLATRWSRRRASPSPAVRGGE